MKRIFHIVSTIILLLQAAHCEGQGIIIPPGAYMIGSNGNMVVKNNFTNNGSFTHNGGTLIFNGTTQTLGGATATTFNNITTATGSTTTISSGGHKLNGILLSNGTLNANGNLTLLSTAAQTAAIDGSGTGEVSGNLIVQRYIASGFGYKYFSSPFVSDTVGDFANDMNLAASFPTFYKHDENLASTGWVTYTAGAGSLNTMNGYAANLGSSTAAITVDLKGVVNNHNVSRTLFNHNMTYTQGFNLVGNPYPSPINWDAVGGWTKTNIDNAVYYFNASSTNQYTGVYSSYINGVSSDGIAGSTIPAMQGFFVHVSNGAFPVTGQLIVTNTARILNPTIAFFRAYGPQYNQPLLRLSAGFAEVTTVADPVTFYFSGDAAGNFNKALDALKLMNTDTIIPNLYALSDDAQKLSIQALPAISDSITVVPLVLAIKKEGWINFTVKAMQDIPQSANIWFTDLVTGVNENLRTDAVYRVQLAAGVYENRFFLKFSKKNLDEVKPPAGDGFKAYSADGRLFVNGNMANGEKGDLTVVNMLGQVICRQQISGNVYTAVGAGFTSGVYVVNFTAGNKKQSKKIFIAAR